MLVSISHIPQTFHTIALALDRYVARVPIMCTVLSEVVSMRASYTFYFGKISSAICNLQSAYWSPGGAAGPLAAI